MEADGEGGAASGAGGAADADGGAGGGGDVDAAGADRSDTGSPLGMGCGPPDNGTGRGPSRFSPAVFSLAHPARAHGSFRAPPGRDCATFSANSAEGVDPPG
ncbi:hypothetical protein GCM10010326_42930 [Streptomyces xanthochromogenes]|uniref:Uncharacterized protein n=1 Tax=Streptomyces xanthochromogenes TaxID=67384 RepID=A0ABQ3ABB2_9ACTN|nr:hypothetical protein GCM10010326_42930 [Streptomyces xanthochromogenes]